MAKKLVKVSHIAFQHNEKQFHQFNSIFQQDYFVLAAKRLIVALCWGALDWASRERNLQPHNVTRSVGFEPISPVSMVEHPPFHHCIMAWVQIKVKQRYRATFHTELRKSFDGVEKANSSNAMCRLWLFQMAWDFFVWSRRHPDEQWSGTS